MQKEQGHGRTGVAAVILAAGLGTRMKSGKAKVLHEVAGLPMVRYVVDVARRVAEDLVLVIGNQAEAVRRSVGQDPSTAFALQEEQLGTGHAVQCALPSLPPHSREVVILCGDVPLLRPETLARFVDEHRRRDRDLSLLVMEADDPTGYGRILFDAGGKLCGIVEEADASPEQRRLRMVNTGIYCVGKDFLSASLHRIGRQNAQGEVYLTDLTGIGHGEGRRQGVTVAADPEDFMGVNTPRDLEKVDRIMRRRLLEPNRR